MGLTSKPINPPRFIPRLDSSSTYQFTPFIYKLHSKDITCTNIYLFYVHIIISVASSKIISVAFERHNTNIIFMCTLLVLDDILQIMRVEINRSKHIIIIKKDEKIYIFRRHTTIIKIIESILDILKTYYKLNTM